MTDPHTVIDDLERRAQEALRRAEAAQAEIAQVTGVATSEDGAATVTVSATGALVDVSFGKAADKISKERLAQSVVAAARRAQAGAARRVTDLMTPVIGEDSEAMRHLRDQLPKAEEPAGPPKHRAVTVYNEERETPRKAPAPPRPAPTEDEHDYEQRTVLKKGRR